MRLTPAQSLRFCGRQFTVAELAQLRHWLAELRLSPTALRRVWLDQWGRATQMDECPGGVAADGAGGFGASSRPPAAQRQWTATLPGPAPALPQIPFTTPVPQLPGLSLEVVATPAAAALYRQLMAHYHYLGNTPLAGAQLRYLIRCQDTVLGGMGWGASAWSVAVRDQFIGWSAEQRQRQLYQIVNHSRFLILPWVHSPNLASYVLARMVRQLPEQWQQRYGYRPVLLESFVEQERFEGTCYQAANWRCLGLTQGRGKLEKTGRPILPVKWVFIYPLVSDFIERLKR